MEEECFVRTKSCKIRQFGRIIAHRALERRKIRFRIFFKKKHDSFFPLFVVGLVVTIRAQLEMSNLSHPSNL